MTDESRCIEQYIVLCRETLTERGRARRDGQAPRSETPQEGAVLRTARCIRLPHDRYPAARLARPVVVDAGTRCTLPVLRVDLAGSGFWFTVFKVELADIAFAIDSILAAAAIALALPEVGGDFFGVNAGQYTVMLIGGLIGVIIMRFFATWFVELLNRKPGLEVAAFIIVGWVGVSRIPEHGN